MPLHDWTDRDNWDGFHNLWIAELLWWIKPRLPAPYRAYIGTTNGPRAVSSAQQPLLEVTVPSLETSRRVHVECRGFLVAVVELVSPRNKDRPSAREASAIRYAAYLRAHVNLLLVDLFRRPIGFSFPDDIAADLEFAQPPCPAPCAVSYRIGDFDAMGAANSASGLIPWRSALCSRR